MKLREIVAGVTGLAFCWALAWAVAAWADRLAPARPVSATRSTVDEFRIYRGVPADGGWVQQVCGTCRFPDGGVIPDCGEKDPCDTVEIGAFTNALGPLAARNAWLNARTDGG